MAAVLTPERRHPYRRRSDHARRLRYFVSAVFIAAAIIGLEQGIGSLVDDTHRIGRLERSNHALIAQQTAFAQQAVGASKERAFIECRDVESVKSTLRQLTAKSEQQTIAFLHVLHIPVTGQVRANIERQIRSYQQSLAPKSCHQIASIGPSTP